MDDDEAEHLKAAFGDSSNEEKLLDLPEKETPKIGNLIVFERVKNITGLHHQSDLLTAILNEGWFVEESINQAIRFGDLPSWATKVYDLIRETVTTTLIVLCAAAQSHPLTGKTSQLISQGSWVTRG